MKIVNIKKLVKSLSIILGIIFVLSLVIANSTLSHVETKYNTVYVKSGDTLWNIATNLQNSSYYKGRDVRYIISDLKEINDLNTSTLHVNQKIKVPTI